MEIIKSEAQDFESQLTNAMLLKWTKSRELLVVYALEIN